MLSTGEKPGIGLYKCTECNHLIKLKNVKEKLPTCSKCNNKEFQKVSITRREKISAELFSFFFWTFLIIKIIFFDFDNFIIQNYFPSFSWILKYKFFILLGFIAFFCLIIRSKKIFILILFTFTYPFFFVFWRIPKFLFRRKNWFSIFTAIGILVSFFKNAKLNFVIFTLVNISGLLIVATKLKITLIPSIVVLFTFLIIHFCRRFSYGFKQFDIFSKGADSFIKLWQQLQNAIKQTEAHQKTEKYINSKEDEKEKSLNRLQILLIINKGLYFLSSKLNNIQRRGLSFFYYSLSLIYSVSLVIIIFAFQNFALYKINPSSFSNQIDGKLIFFIYYSINTLFTNNISDFYPVSAFARLFNTVEMLFGVLILVILVYLFFNIAREKLKMKIDHSIVLLEHESRNLERIIQNEYQLTIDQAIEEVEKIKGSMLKILNYFISNID